VPASRERALRPLRIAILATLVSCGGEPSDSGAVSVAVAANFSAAQEALAARFTETSGTPVVSSAGSSGQLYAQIENGAPFHIFLSADQERPRLLEQEGKTVAGSRFTYAEGRLALWAPRRDAAEQAGPDLLELADARLAIANPATAPYGAAAVSVLERMGAAERLAGRIVQGESVAQVQSFVGSSAAEMGFLSLAQVVSEPALTYWIVPGDLHAPILQDAVLLTSGGSHAGARAYLEFLKSTEAHRILEEHGYRVPGAGGP
jgi:molybdate transport system substrate-binding protein